METRNTSKHNLQELVKENTIAKIDTEASGIIQNCTEDMLKQIIQELTVNITSNINKDAEARSKKQNEQLVFKLNEQSYILKTQLKAELTELSSNLETKFKNELSEQNSNFEGQLTELSSNLETKFKMELNEQNTKLNEQSLGQLNELSSNLETKFKNELSEQNSKFEGQLKEQSSKFKSELNDQEIRMSSKFRTQFNDQKELISSELHDQNERFSSELTSHEERNNLQLREQVNSINSEFTEQIVRLKLNSEEHYSKINITLNEINSGRDQMETIVQQISKSTNDKLNELQAIADIVVTSELKEVQRDKTVKFWLQKTEENITKIDDNTQKLTELNEDIQSHKAKTATELAEHKESLDCFRASDLQRGLNEQAFKVDLEEKIDIITTKLEKITELMHPTEHSQVDETQSMYNDDYFNNADTYERHTRGYLEKCRPLQMPNETWPITFNQEQSQNFDSNQFNYSPMQVQQTNTPRVGQDEFDYSQDRRLTHFLHRESIPVYDGNNVSAPKFLEDLEAFFRSFAITNDKVKLKSVPTFLLQNAQEWFRISSREITTWHQFKEAFLNQYFGPLEQQRLEDQWNNSVCKPHYDVERFVLRAINTQNLIRSHEPMNKRCHNIIRKLPNELRDFLALQQYSTFNEFLLAVKDGMRYKGITNTQNYRSYQKNTNMYGKDAYGQSPRNNVQPQQRYNFKQFNNNNRGSTQNYRQNNYNQNSGYNNYNRRYNNQNNQNNNQNYGSNQGQSQYNNNQGPQGNGQNNQQSRRPWYHNRQIGYTRRFRGRRRPQRRGQNQSTYYNQNQNGYNNQNNNSGNWNPNGQPNGQNLNLGFMGHVQQNTQPQGPNQGLVGKVSQTTNVGNATVATNTAVPLNN